MNVPSSFFPRFGEISELVKKGATLEAQERIMELRKEVHDLHGENISLRSENNELREKIKSSNNLEWEHPYYWLKTVNGKEGPFCQICQDSDNKLIRLQGHKASGLWECKQCNNRYHTDQYKHPKQTRVIWG